MRRLGLFLALLLFAILGFCVGKLYENTVNGTVNHAALALSNTGLPVEYAPTYSLHGYTGFRDFFGQTKFIVSPYGWDDDRQNLLTEIKSAKGWHIAPVTGEEYLKFQKDCMWEYALVLDVPEDIVFDAWFYRASRDPASYSDFAPAGALSEIGQVGYGYEFAVYDVETGLFIYVDLFG